MKSIEFDHHSEEYAQQWPEVHEELRRTCPVAHTKAHDGFWVLSKYEDVYEVARDDETFSSKNKVNIIPPLKTGLTFPIDSDPPDLFRYRGIINPFLTPVALRPMEPIITEFVNEAIESVRDSGRIDFITDLANPVPAKVTMQLLGLNVDYWEMFAEPVHEMTFMHPDSPERQEAVRRVLEFEKVVKDELRSRIDAPRGDMMSVIVHSEVDGIATTFDEAVAMVLMVIHGGVDTVTSAIGNMLLYLGRNPERRRQLIEDRNLIRSAIEELLRYEPPITGFARKANRECIVGGQSIPEGDRLLMLWASANRDDAEFENPHDVDFERRPNRHLSFGIGNHRCLGSSLARIELNIVLNRILDEMPEYEIDETGVVDAHDVSLVLGRRHVPAKF